MFFRRPACLNAIKVLFTPSQEALFTQCETKIKDNTGWLDREIVTAGFEAAKKTAEEVEKRDEEAKMRSDNILQYIKSMVSPTANMNVTLPFRFLQNCPRRNGFFGRDEHLSKLDRYLDQTQAYSPRKMRSVVLHGLGGCGKSSIAREYMYRHFDTNEYQVILWLYADSRRKLATQFIYIARQLNQDTSENEARDVVLHWINNLSNAFLMVFDNADDPSILMDFCPASTYGSIIITSRNPFTQDYLAQHALPVKSFTGDEGSKFLHSMIPSDRPPSAEDEEAILWLTRFFGGLPLALRQVGAYITHLNCSPSHFKQLYEKFPGFIDDYKPPGALKHEKTVSDVWELSSRILSEDSRIILDTMSLLDPDSIPAELFCITNVPHAHAEVLDNPLRIVAARGHLMSQSLIEHDHHTNSFSMHRLVSKTTFEKMHKNVSRLQHTLNFSIHLLHRFSPEIDLLMIRNPSHWTAVEKVLSHVRSIYDRCKDIITNDDAALLLEIMTKILNYGFESAQYGLGDQAFAHIQELLLKIQHPDDEILALVYFAHGRLCCETSRQLQALEEIVQSHTHIRKAAVHKPCLLKTTLYIRILSNLGITHTAVERFEEAEVYHKTAIQHCKDLGMDKECSIGNLMQNLANCYLWGNKLTEAKEMLDQAQLHPNTAPEAVDYTLGNWMLKNQRYDEAMQLHTRVLALYAKHLGQKHPVTADSWHKVGTMFANKAFSGYNPTEADPTHNPNTQKNTNRHCFRKTLDIWQGLAQAHNPVADLFVARVQSSLSALLDTLSEAGNSESEELRREAWIFLQKRLGGRLIEGLDLDAALESLVFYWSR
ncbi:hypothetical protein COCMIDRAFT_25875 [Bipolaris oryzae ATCC 44560]|uniref:Uncharacterized protein n=1 Tax=Bipolaris oryzae ATCC 44560 TaxID=930090 RepID=W6Z2L5_COCMI|nr:uncharacterized protein COCMIDRAFT_25875 [Bipolaris oryzae ATCC 44560]EUC45997.1 hypothetical protein COCMIDRAFT_25875 [Bipolaris oryzae ATCC 44560]